MTRRETRHDTMLTRAKAFGDEHRERVVCSAVGRAQFAIVETAVARLNEHAVAKLAAAQVTGAAKAFAKAALMEALHAIGRTARVMGPVATGMAHLCRAPPRSDRGLVTAGLLAARDAEAIGDQFIAHGLPPTFIADLRTLIDHIEDVMRQRHVEKSDHAAARDQITAELASGMAAVQTLDPVVANALRRDSLTLEIWRRERHVRSGRRTRAMVEPASTAALPPATTPPPGAPSASPAF